MHSPLVSRYKKYPKLAIVRKIRVSIRVSTRRVLTILNFSSETNRESCCRTFLQNSEIRSLNLYIDDTKKLFDRGKILPRINVFDTRKSIKSIYDDGWKKDWNNRELELKRYEVCMEDQSPSSSMFHVQNGGEQRVSCPLFPFLDHSPQLHEFFDSPV